MTEIIIKDPQARKVRFRSLAKVQIFRAPYSFGSGEFHLAVEPNDMFSQFVIDPDAMNWASTKLSEYAAKMHLRENDVIKLQQFAIEMFEDLYARGLCEFQDLKVKIIGEE